MVLKTIVGFARAIQRAASGGRAGLVGRVLAMMLSLSEFGATLATAQEYPSKPIRLVVPWAAGGGADVVARQLADKLSQRLGQTLIIQNMPGATATIGTRAVAAADSDGYTLLVATSEHTINQAYFKDLPYDGIRDFPRSPRDSSAAARIVDGDSHKHLDIRRTGQTVKGKTRKSHLCQLGQGKLGPAWNGAHQAANRTRSPASSLQRCSAGADRCNERGRG